MSNLRIFQHKMDYKDFVQQKIYQKFIFFSIQLTKKKQKASNKKEVHVISGIPAQLFMYVTIYVWYEL